MTKTCEKRSTTLSRHLAADLIDVFDRMVEDRRERHWTPDASGRYFSEKIAVDAMESFVRCHPDYGIREIGLFQLDVKSCTEAMQRAREKRGGRVSTFDEKVMKLIVMLLSFAKHPINEHQGLLRSVSKKSTNRSRPAIKRRSIELREKILSYCASNEPTPGYRAFQEARDRAMLAILLTCSPLRVNTIILLRKEHCDGTLISIPRDAMKGREAISFELADLAANCLDRYLHLCPQNEGWLFTDAKQNRATRNMVYKSLRRKCERILSLRLGTHDFRRIMATAIGQKLGQELAASTLAISLEILKSHYDLSDNSQRLSHAIRKINLEL